MCGPGKVVQSDPEAEAQLAAEKATQETNKRRLSVTWLSKIASWQAQ